MEADGITPKTEECGTANGVPQYCYPAQGIGVRVYDELGSGAARVTATARPASLAGSGDDAESLLSQRPAAARPMAWSNSHWRPLTPQEIGESDSPWAELYRQANGIPALPQAH
ncbi:MAG: hypothetical protein HYV63_28705 [Candidatus Schekmanbacteria bacterium]|nr:hypothetical protein [Candidatus Schekmanbacteria bacterium]